MHQRNTNSFLKYLFLDISSAQLINRNIYEYIRNWYLQNKMKFNVKIECCWKRKSNLISILLGTYICTTVSKKPLKDSERYTRIESICVLHKTTLKFLRLFSAPQQETLAFLYLALCNDFKIITCKWQNVAYTIKIWKSTF